MSCKNCCYLITPEKIRDIVGLQVDSTFTGQAGKTALDQAHEIALDNWIGDSCRESICNTIELQQTTLNPTPEELILFEKTDCLFDYVQKFLAFQTLSYFVQLNPSIRVSGSGVGRGSVSQSRPFSEPERDEKVGLVTNWSSFAQSWRNKANRWLELPYSDVLFPDYTKNRDFFPCLSTDDNCKESPQSYGAGFYLSSI